MNTIYEKNMWLCIILDGDRNVYNDDASKRYLGSYFDYFVLLVGYRLFCCC